MTFLYTAGLIISYLV